MSRRIARAFAALLAAAFAACTPSPPHTSRVAGDVVEALAPFSVDPVEREAAAARPAEARFLDGRIVWPIRNVRAGLSFAQRDRASLALLTLERYLGWAVLQRAATEFRIRFAGQPTTASDLLRVAGEISGRDLGWMAGLFDPALEYDYAIDRVETRRIDQDSYRVDVIAKRYGNGIFTGTTNARVGPFDAGRGITIAVAFADGQKVTDTWDGRDAERRFSYASAAPVVSASIDEDGIIAVDQSRANNVWTAADDSNRAEAKRAALAWSARWAAWLQDRLLLWSVLF